MIPFSVLDLAPVTEGSTPAQSFRNSRALAQQAERLGYRRYWLAEHHNMPGIASAATALVIQYVAEATSTIRVGAGGIMLPNHAPLTVAEQFGTLASLYPGRIDLGLGRAPGTDGLTAHALRRTLAGDERRFPEDVLELLSYFEPAQPGQRVRAVPGAGLDVPVWILGSSLFGAQLAAALGLPYAFASHFAPADLMPAIALYRETFRPSKYLSAPYVMLGFNVIAAPAEKEAQHLATSWRQAYLNLRRGRPGLLPPPREDLTMSAEEQTMLAHMHACSVVGDPETVEAGLRAFIEKTAADELIIAGQIFEHHARLRSYEIVAAARARLAKAPPLRA